MPNIVTFDPINLRIIEIGTGGDNELSWLEIYSEWKDWLLADASRLGYPQAFRVVGGDPISGVANLGSTFFMLYPWKFRPAELSHRLRLVGNMFSDPAGQSVVVPTLGLYTVLVEQEVSNLVDSVLVNSPEIQVMSFSDRAVLVDPTNVTGLAEAGTAYPAGTGRQPVNNFTDALVIAATYGLSKMRVLGGTSLVPVQLGAGDYTGFHFIGDGADGTHMEVLSAAQVERTSYFEMSLHGVFDGTAEIHSCAVSSVSMVAGVLRSCRLKGNISLNSSSARFTMVDCVDDGAGLVASPQIDFGGDGPACVIRNYRGGLRLTNKSGAQDVSIDGILRLVLEAGFAGSGVLVVRGIGPAIENLAGFPESQIVNHLVDPLDTRLTRQLGENRMEVDIGTQELVLYADDGVTILQRWALSTTGSEPVVTQTGVQTKRGAPIL